MVRAHVKGLLNDKYMDLLYERRNSLATDFPDTLPEIIKSLEKVEKDLEMLFEMWDRLASYFPEPDTHNEDNY